MDIINSTLNAVGYAITNHSDFVPRVTHMYICINCTAYHIATTSTPNTIIFHPFICILCKYANIQTPTHIKGSDISSSIIRALGPNNNGTALVTKYLRSTREYIVETEVDCIETILNLNTYNYTRDGTRRDTDCIIYCANNTVDGNKFYETSTILEGGLRTVFPGPISFSCLPRCEN